MLRAVCAWRNFALSPKGFRSSSRDPLAGMGPPRLSASAHPQREFVRLYTYQPGHPHRTVKLLIRVRKASTKPGLTEQ